MDKFHNFLNIVNCEALNRKIYKEVVARTIVGYHIAFRDVLVFLSLSFYFKTFI